MQIDCEVIGAESNGDTVQITLQGKPPSAAIWRNLELQTINLPANNPVARAYHVGRKVRITIETR